MKNIFALLVSGLLLLGLQSCNEEVVSADDGRQTAVVYALLDASEQFHYIKINRAIYGSGNSLEIAQVPDSSYFDQVDAVINEYKNGSIARSWVLRDTIIENKEPGAFYYPQQKLYYFKTTTTEPLLDDKSTRYKLDANINNGEFTVNGETVLVSGMLINSPKQNSSFNFASDQVSSKGYEYTSVNVNVGNAARIEVNLTVEFEEYIGTTLFATKSFIWKIGEFDNITTATVSASAFGKTFYDLVALNATNNSDITKRKLKAITIAEYGAEESFQKYLLVNKPSSSLTQSKPLFTNMTATNNNRVLGVFSSRGTAIRVKPAWEQVSTQYYRCLNKNSTKELCQGAITGHLLFCSDHPNDLLETYFCP